MSDEAKPVLWVALTDHGRGTTEDGMRSVAERVKEAVGDDYHVVAADDKVRLATQEDLQEMRNAIDSLLPSDLETEAEREERRREEIGLSTDDVMGGNEDAPGVQEEADGGDDA